MRGHKQLHIRLAVASIGLLLLGFLVSWSAAVLIISLVATHYIVSRYTGMAIFDTTFWRSILSIVAYVAILQAVIMTTWIVDRNFPLDCSILLTGVFLILAALLEYYFHVTTSKHVVVRHVSVNDGWALGVAVFLVILTTGGPIAHYAHAYKRLETAPIAAAYIDTSLDDSSHLSRINDRLQLNRGVLYGSNVTQYVVNQSTISTYPPSWHAANASLIKAFYPSIAVGGESLVAYVLTKVFWLFILGFVFTRTILSLYEVFVRSQKRAGSADYIWLLGTSGFFAYYTLLEQFREGFYSFLPLLISQLLCLALLTQLAVDRTEDTKERNFAALLPLTILFTNAALSWFLLLPAVALSLLCSVLYGTSRAKLLSTIRIMFSQLWAQLPVFGVLALSVIVQKHILTAGTSRTFRQGVNDPGAITAHSQAYFMFVFMGAALFFGFLKLRSRLATDILPYLAGLLGVATFIYMYQLLTIHKPEYYYAKTLNTVIIVALPLAILGFLQLVKLITTRYAQLGAVAIVTSLFLCLPLIIGVEPLNASNLGYITGDRAFTFNENSYIYRNITERSKVPLQNRTADTIFYSPTDLGYSVIGTNIVRSIQNTDGCDGAEFYAIISNNQPSLFDNIASCQKSHLTIVTHRAELATVKQLVARRGLAKNVSVVTVH